MSTPRQANTRRQLYAVAGTEGGSDPSLHTMAVPVKDFSRLYNTFFKRWKGMRENWQMQACAFRENPPKAGSHCVATGHGRRINKKTRP